VLGCGPSNRVMHMSILSRQLVFVGLAVAGCGLALALAGARFNRAPVRSRTRPPDAAA